MHDLINLKRPKLLMAAAKEFTKRKIFLKGKDAKLSKKELESRLKAEVFYETQRQNRASTYQADQHIKILSELIEQASYLFNSKMVN